MVGAMIGILIITHDLPQPPPPTIIDSEPVIEPEPVKPIFTGYKVVGVDTEDLQIPIHKDTYYIPLITEPLPKGTETSATQRIKWSEIVEYVSNTRAITNPDTPSIVGDRFDNRIFVRVNLYELESVKHEIIQQVNDANKVYNEEITQIQSPQYQKHYEYAKGVQFNLQGETQ